MHLCLAYPNIDPNDRELIYDFRRLHDAKYVDVVDVHWTVIFPGSTKEFDLSALHDHISSVASNVSPIEFICRYALVYDDDSNDDYYIFLVPDEGFSQISLLHDALYSGMMRPYLRLDIPYVPHIGIATSTDKDHLYRLATEWNSRGKAIRGRIDSLTLSSYDGNRVEDITHFKLTKSEIEVR
jgi:2'-5' RNA ligase